MKQLNPRIERLKTMMSLEEKRSALQGELAAIQQQLANLQKRLFDDSAVAEEPAAKSSVKVKYSASKRARRGALSENILAALSSAGEAGIRVKDLASSIGVKAANIHSWFQSTAKRHPSIKKLAAGVYGLDGNAAPVVATPARTEAKAKPAEKKSRTGKRGALAEKIVSILEAAGSDGITIKEIAAKVGAEYRNISIWFATTGKKNAKIKKLGPAHYKLAV